MRYFFYLLLGMLVSQQVVATLTISHLLTTFLEEPNQIVIFKKMPSTLSEFSTIQLHFLSSNDCQSGYMARFDSLEETQPFRPDEAQLFGLRGAEVYQAGVSVLTKSPIDNAHSILIRFVHNKTQFARFTGRCNDQQINCCIPIRCSSRNATCQAQYNLGVQDLV